MIEKNWHGVAPDPAWVEHEIERLERAVDEFADAMKAKLAEKARGGWTGWDNPQAKDNIYTAMLAQGAAIKYAKDQEIDIANLAMMLWRLNR